MRLDTALWRSVAVFRIATVVYAAILLASHFRRYAHPAAGWALLGVMLVWTAVAGYAYAAPHRRRWWLLGTDLTIAAGCLIASQWIVRPTELRHGAATVPSVWVAAAVLAWAVSGSRLRGAIAALVIGGIDVAIRGTVTQTTVNGAVLLLLAGVVTGHVVRLATDAEERLERAVELEAATRERERLARGIHDSVLQVLALVQRRGAELGGAAAELGRLAGEQETTLRALIAASPAPAAAGSVDLRALLQRYASSTVSIAAPAAPVRLPSRAAAEVAAAVGSALDNVRVHCGSAAPAWVLLEEEADGVVVTVRDDGPGIPDGRLAEAEAAGRLGIAQSIRGRVRDLGGTATITTSPGQGTEVELHLPKN